MTLARTTIAQFHAGATKEATHILRDIMLPKAQEQQGFEGALILSDPLADKGIIVTFWSTEEDLMASQPPEEIVPHVERLGELIADVTQGTYDVFFQLHKKLGTQEQGEQP